MGRIITKCCLAVMVVVVIIMMVVLAICVVLKEGLTWLMRKMTARNEA